MFNREKPAPIWSLYELHRDRFGVTRELSIEADALMDPNRTYHRIMSPDGTEMKPGNVYQVGDFAYEIGPARKIARDPYGKAKHVLDLIKRPSVHVFEGGANFTRNEELVERKCITRDNFRINEYLHWIYTDENGVAIEIRVEPSSIGDSDKTYCKLFVPSREEKPLPSSFVVKGCHYFVDPVEHSQAETEPSKLLDLARKPEIKVMRFDETQRTWKWVQLQQIKEDFST